MSDVFTIDGATADLDAMDAVPIRYAERLGGVPTLTIQRRGIDLPPEADDPWRGKSITWTHDGVLYFAGDFASRSPRRDHCGWTPDYVALGIRNRMDKFALTDDTTGLDVSAFNCHPEDLVNYRADRAGRTIGEILTAVLTGITNAGNMASYGLGNYTGLPSAPALPAATVADLAALDVVYPAPVYVTGQRFGDALAGVLQRCAPNHRMRVEPDGTVRFLDLGGFTATTLTMDTDPIEPTELSRDVGDCFQRVLVRGAPVAVLTPFKLSAGRLAEDFAWGSFDNASAKAAWTSADFKGTTRTIDEGAASMSSTTTIAVTSDDASHVWAANYWDQTSTGVKGTINLEDTALTGVTMTWTSRIVANTALTAGGSSTITIDTPAPHTGYDRYTITGATSGASLVWRQYQIVDTDLRERIVNQSTYPQAVINGGGGATLTSTPIGLVFWSQAGDGTRPFNAFPLPFTYDRGSGNLVFAAPTFTVANAAEPDDIWAYLPVNTGPNQVASPVDVSGVPQYDGTSHTVEGLADTLVVTMPDWRDPGQLSQVQAFADDLLKSVKDGVIEGSVEYHGFYAAALPFGIALNIAGAATTGWEDAALPVVGVDVAWSQGPEDYMTTMSVSNRKGHYSAEMFMRPERSFAPIGIPGGDSDPFGGITGLGLDTGGMLGGMGDAARGAMNDRADAGIGGMNDMADAGIGGMNDRVGHGMGVMSGDVAANPTFDFDPTAFGGGNGLGSAANQTGRADRAKGGDDDE